MKGAIRVGLIVNPRAGLGGRVGLKGSDGEEIQMKAMELGARPQAVSRAAAALVRLASLRENLDIVTWSGEMGADAARKAGFRPTIAGSVQGTSSRPEDTVSAAREMARQRVKLILFAGGDGTARDVHDAIGSDQPVLGIPAGVKMHSAVFGIDPARTGDLALEFLTGKAPSLRKAEVMDLDEEAFRQDRVQVRLYGYMRVPFAQGLLLSRKTPSPASEDVTQKLIAQRVVADMDDEHHYIIGPGTTTLAVLRLLDLEGTLLGVDVLFRKHLLLKDANESALVGFLESGKVKIVVTLIGGQGILFGRGNQQISADVLRHVGPENVIVIATPEKIHSLAGNPLFVDTGDPVVDGMFQGYVRIVTGYQDQIVYRVTA